MKNSEEKSEDILDMYLKKINMGVNLGKSKLRWFLAVCLGLVFLGSLVLSMGIGTISTPLGVMIFWIALWLNWPMHSSSVVEIFFFIIIQIIFCIFFVVLNDLIFRNLHEAVSNMILKLFYFLVVIPFWLRVSHFLFQKIDKKLFGR